MKLYFFPAPTSTVIQVYFMFEKKYWSRTVRKGSKFYHNKTSSFLKDGDTEKVLVSNESYFDEKTVRTLKSCIYYGKVIIMVKLSHYI